MLVNILNVWVLPILLNCLYSVGATLLIGVIAYRIFLWHRFNKYWPQKNIEQVPATFPCGNFYNVLVQKKSIGGFLHDIYKDSNADLSGFYIFHIPHILLRSPDLIKRVLVSDFRCFHDRVLASDHKADPVCSKMLINVKNPEWKVMRQKMTPIFTASKIRAMSEHIVKSCDDFIKYLDDNYKNGPCESKNLCSKFSIDVITSCAFGVEANSFLDENAPFLRAARHIVEQTFINGSRQMCYFLLPQAVKLFRIAFLQPRSIQFLKHAFLHTIAHRESEDGVPRGDLIDIIIELKKNKDLGGGIVFEKDRIVAQGVQFFAAGFETTSGTLSFALYELALNPNMQKAARQIVVDYVNDGGKLNYDAMAKMSHLERIALEALRKYPPIPFLERRCNDDFYIPELDVTIPKGTPIFISVLGVHFNEEYYPNPSKFDPDRFLPEIVKKRNPFAFLSFGQGPHNCIGERFAMNAIKLCLAHFLLKYKVEPCAETQIPLEFSPKFVTMIPKKGIILKYVKL